MGASHQGPFSVESPQPHKARTSKTIFVVILDEYAVRTPVHHHYSFHHRVCPVGEPAGHSTRQRDLPAVVVRLEVFYSSLPQVLLAARMVKHHTRCDALGGYHQVQVGLMTRQVDTAGVARGCHVAPIVLECLEITTIPISAHNTNVRFGIVFGHRLLLRRLCRALSGLAPFDGDCHVLNV